MVNSANKIDFFTTPIQQADEAVFSAMQDELHRQQNQIELIASENIVSKAVLQAQGSVLTNKYAEGYPGRRYYGGCEHVDTVEVLAIERACALFGAKYANVQPHSGSQANQGVFLALLKPGDTFMGMDLSAGGHLTHGAKPNLSGKWFHCVTYGVHPDTHLIDYDKIHATALEHKPKLIIAGGSAYPRFIDFKRFREIADEVGAFLLVDMAHFAGLVAGGEFPSPLEHAHVVTSTTHKVLRGPRGGLILSNDDTLFKKLNSAIFPGLQGGPLMHVIAAKAVSFGECLSPAYTAYAQAVVENAKSLTQTLINCGFDLVSGGTDCHLCLVDLRPYAVTGEQAENSLERAGLTCNKNGIPFDPLPPSQTSGIRLGTPAGTTRGFGEVEFQQVGHLIADVLAGLRDKGPENNHGAESKARKTVQTLCKQFPIYTD